MAEQRQQFKLLSPQVVIGVLPQRLSAVDLFVRSLIIESAQGNNGEIYIADSEANVTTTNRHVLKNQGDNMSFESDPWGNLDAQINLKNIWIHGDKIGNRIVSSYLEITTEALQ